jgi:hypothetical protein
VQRAVDELGAHPPQLHVVVATELSQRLERRVDADVGCRCKKSLALLDQDAGLQRVLELLDLSPGSGKLVQHDLRTTRVARGLLRGRV